MTREQARAIRDLLKSGVASIMVCNVANMMEFNPSALDGFIDGKAIQERSGAAWVHVENPRFARGTNHYRLKPEPVARPYQLDELAGIIGSTINRGGREYIIDAYKVRLNRLPLVEIRPMDPYQRCPVVMDAGTLLSTCTNIDGSPCGVTEDAPDA